MNEIGEILFQRRSDSFDWGLPGGAMEPGETPEETARRELKEETGLDAGALQLLGVFSGPRYYYRYRSLQCHRAVPGSTGPRNAPDLRQ